MSQSLPQTQTPYAHRPPSKPSQRPYLPSIDSSSVYLTPIQEQRILSWRTHATPPPSPLGLSALGPTPGLTHTNTTGTISSGSARAALYPGNFPPPRSRASQRPQPQVHAHTHAGPQPAIPKPASVDSSTKVKSAPASLAAPASRGSQCHACGAVHTTVSVLSNATHPSSRDRLGPAYPRTPKGPGTTSPMIPHHMQMGTDHRRPDMSFTPITGTGTGMGLESGNSSRQRSYYSTKKYRQARAMEMREQNGYGTSDNRQNQQQQGMDSGSRSGAGVGRDQWAAGVEGEINIPGPDVPSKQTPQMGPAGQGPQPEWGVPNGVASNRAPYQPHVPAEPLPLPRIGGARDPVSQNYWRNMYPPTGGPQGINSGMSGNMMGQGMGMFHPPMMMMPGMMPFH